jgi:hypothetical protein
MPRIDLHPRKSPRQARSADTVETILAAATRVLERESLAGFNTNRVAEAAGDGEISAALIGATMQNPWRDPSPAHLWFLLYLLWFCAAAACAWAALRVVPRAARETMRGACANAVVRWCSGWRSVLAVLALALAAALPMLAMPSPGIATPRSFAPDPAILLCYGVFFFGGWVLALDPRAIDALKRGAWWRVAAGSAALVVAVVLSIAWYVAVSQGRAPAEGGVRALLVATQAVTALAAWLLALGGAGAAGDHGSAGRLHPGHGRWRRSFRAGRAALCFARRQRGDDRAALGVGAGRRWTARRGACAADAACRAGNRDGAHGSHPAGLMHKSAVSRRA